MPKDGVIQYEAAVKADGFPAMAPGAAAEMARAKEIPGGVDPSSLAPHAGARDEQQLQVAAEAKEREPP